MEGSVLEETEQDCKVNVSKNIKPTPAVDKSNDRGLDRAGVTNGEGVTHVNTSPKSGLKGQLGGFRRNEPRAVNNGNGVKRGTILLTWGEVEKRARKESGLTQLQTYATRAKGKNETYAVRKSDREEGRDLAVTRSQSTKLKGAMNSQPSVDGEHRQFESSHLTRGSWSGRLKYTRSPSDPQGLDIICRPSDSLWQDEDSKTETGLSLEKENSSSSFDEESDEEALTVSGKGEPEEHCAPMVISKLSKLVEKYVPIHNTWGMVTKNVRYKIFQGLQNSIDGGEKISIHWIMAEASKAHLSAQHKAKQKLWKEHCESIRKAARKAVRKTARKAGPPVALKYPGTRSSTNVDGENCQLSKGSSTKLLKFTSDG